MRISCVSNLKQIGLSYRVWEGDYSQHFPMAVAETNGGTMKFVTGANAFRHFQVMSNELGAPIVLVCPADNSRAHATNFNLNNSNISYFVGVDANSTNAQMLLTGDRNITNGTPVKNGILELTTARPGAWTEEIHKHAGNIGFADGSVAQFSTSGLRSTITNTTISTNRLQMPILTP